MSSDREGSEFANVSQLQFPLQIVLPKQLLFCLQAVFPVQFLFLSQPARLLLQFELPLSNGEIPLPGITLNPPRRSSSEDCVCSASLLRRAAKRFSFIIFCWVLGLFDIFGLCSPCISYLFFIEEDFFS